MPNNLHGIGFGILDPDDRGGDITLVIAVDSGTIAAAAGDSGATVVSGSGTGTVTLSGTATELDNLLRDNSTGTLAYTALTSGTKTFTLTATDEDSLATVSTYAVTVIGFTAPVMTEPGSGVTIDVGDTTDIHGIGFAVSDADDLGALATCTIVATDGTVDVTVGNSGVSVTSGNGTTSVTLSGTISNLDGLLDGTSNGTIEFTSDDAGAETITITVTDFEGLSDNGQVTVTSGSAPVVTAPDEIGAVESVGENIEGQGFAVTDADDGGGTATCVINTTVGTITVTVGNSGVSISSGNGTATVTFTGTISQINNLLTDVSTGTIVLTYGSTGDGTVTVTVTDSTTRVGTNNCPISVETATPTWQGYVQATPQAATATVNNFVALIDLSTFPDSWWSIVSADGRDIRTTNTSNANIARDLIAFDKTTKTGLLATKITQGTSPSALRVWAGTSLASQPAAGDTYGQYNVYASHIRGFWPYGAGSDRTSYGNDAVMTGTTTVGGSTGPFSALKATQYGDGISALVDDSLLTSYPIGILAWGNLDTSGADATIGVFTDDDNNGDILTLGLRLAKIRAFTTWNDRASFAVATANPSVTTGTWLVYGGSWASNSSRTVYYQPANSVTTNTTVAAATFPTPYVILGSNRGSASASRENFWTGKISGFFLLQGHTTTEFVPWATNYALMKDQATYWGTWSFTSDTVTGL